MKLNLVMSKFLTNKIVLNVVAILAVFNVIGYLIMGNLNAVIYFILFSVVVRYFSKNMILVLGVPLILVNLFSLTGNIMEGMENNKKSEKKDENQKKIDDIVNKNKNKPDSKTSQGLIMHPIESANESSENKGENTENKEQQGFEPGRRKNKGNEIDYASTIEDAYDELNNILGSDGIKRLTSDTQNLMKQQMQLAEAMKGMTPVIKSIAPMVENLKGMMGQMGEGSEGLGSVMNLAKQFSNQSNLTK
jgi:hypothetical protein